MRDHKVRRPKQPGLANHVNQHQEMKGKQSGSFVSQSWSFRAAFFVHPIRFVLLQIIPMQSKLGSATNIAEVTLSLLCWRCAIAFCNTVSADRSGTAASRCPDRYLFCSNAMRFWLFFARDVIWMSRNIYIVLFRVNGGSLAKKSWLACATGVVALAWNQSRFAIVEARQG